MNELNPQHEQTRQTARQKVMDYIMGKLVNIPEVIIGEPVDVEGESKN